MGDHHRGLASLAPTEGLEDQRFRLGVDGAQGVVEDEDRRVVDERAGKSHPLPLPPGESHAPFPDLGVVALLELQDRVVHGGDRGRLVDLPFSRARTAETDVVPQRLRVEEGLLHHRGDLSPNFSKLQAGQVVTIDGDRSLLGIVKTKEQVRDGRLPGTRGTEEGQGGPPLNLEGDLIENEVRTTISEGDAIERDRPSGDGKRPDRPHRRRAFPGVLQDHPDAIDGHQSLAELGEDSTHHANRPDEHRHRGQEEVEGADW